MNHGWPSSHRRRSLRESPGHNNPQLRLPPQSISTSHQQPTTQSLLLQLSESCQNHKGSCHPGAAGGEECAHSWEHVPTACQAALTSLQRIVPQVENSCSSRDVVHLAHFFSNALDGGFCPHAPHVFLHNDTSEYRTPHMSSLR